MASPKVRLDPAYKILFNASSVTLAVYVDLDIQAGWRPLGGVAAVQYGPGTTHFYQAMVREPLG